jgi:hypothetical protein
VKSYWSTSVDNRGLQVQGRGSAGRQRKGDCPTRAVGGHPLPAQYRMLHPFLDGHGPQSRNLPLIPHDDAMTVRRHSLHIDQEIQRGETQSSARVRRKSHGAGAEYLEATPAEASSMDLLRGASRARRSFQRKKSRHPGTLRCPVFEEAALSSCFHPVSAPVEFETGGDGGLRRSAETVPRVEGWPARAIARGQPLSYSPSHWFSDQVALLR